MKIIFAGTPEFAKLAAISLHEAGHDIVLVLSQPDRPSGRGMKLQASPVKQWAQALSLPVVQPNSLRLDGKYPADAVAARDAIEAADADVMVVAAYGILLPQWVLDTPRLGCLNIHGSLLPRWRGAAPIHRAIEAGDAETGITIMQMDVGLDTGDMLLVESCPITNTDTTASLHDTLASLGSRLIVQALKLAENDSLQPVPQPEEGVTYAHKIEKSEAAINWQDSAEKIGQRIRAFNPFPVASSTLGSEIIKIHNVEIDNEPCSPDVHTGTILSVSDDGVSVACGKGVLLLTELQRAGGKRLPIADFLRGFALVPGMVLGG